VCCMGWVVGVVGAGVVHPPVHHQGFIWFHNTVPILILRQTLFRS
jgi:hypothetical protein